MMTTRAGDRRDARIFRAALLPLVVVLGCVTSTPIYGPNGEPYLRIECNGAANSLGNCYREALRLCPGGYRLADVQSQVGGLVVIPGYYGPTAVQGVSRSIVVECTGGAGAPDAATAGAFVRQQPQQPEEPSPRGDEAEAAGLSVGTCFVVSPDGLVLTAHHVIANADMIKVRLADGSLLDARVEQEAATTDLALLHVNRLTPRFLPLAPPRSARVGQPVFTLGFPAISILGTEAKFTDGSISALSGPGGEASFLQMSVPLQPGSSGGPLVNDQGEVVGVVTASAAIRPFLSETGSLPQNINWAVKAEYALPLLDPPRRPTPTASRQEAIERTQEAVCLVAVSEAPIPVADFRGLWAGGWGSAAQRGAGGALALSIDQNGPSVTGVVHFTGSPCFVGGKLSGVLEEDSFRGAMSSHGVQVDLESRVSGNRIDGIYRVISAGDCTGDTGTFTATR